MYVALNWQNKVCVFSEGIHHISSFTTQIYSKSWLV